MSLRHCLSHRQSQFSGCIEVMIVEVNLEATVAAIAILIGIATYIHTSIRERAYRRAEMVRAYSAELSSAPELVDLFTQIDYNRFRFVADEETWLGNAPEQNMVRLLDVYNSVGHNWQRKVIALADIHGTTLGYGILRAYQSQQVQSYLSYVDKWDYDHLGTGVAFDNFRQLAVALDKRSIKARAKRAKHLEGVPTQAERGNAEDEVD
jgi:hypothetical protein